MKKDYVAPVCTSYNLQIGTLCEGSYAKGNETVTEPNGGWSKGYAGGVEDDSSVDDLWTGE